MKPRNFNSPTRQIGWSCPLNTKTHICSPCTPIVTAPFHHDPRPVTNLRALGFHYFIVNTHILMLTDTPRPFSKHEGEFLGFANLTSKPGLRLRFFKPSAWRWEASSLNPTPLNLGGGRHHHLENLQSGYFIPQRALASDVSPSRQNGVCNLFVGRNNYLYREFLIISKYNGPQNPILIVKAPILTIFPHSYSLHSSAKSLKTNVFRVLNKNPVKSQSRTFPSPRKLHK